MSPFFTVVVPTYNRADRLLRVLDALAKQSCDSFEVVVVDDGSTDATPDLVQRAYPQFSYQRQSNRGPAAARNRGIAVATGEVIAFTDDDVVVPPEWLERLRDGYARHPHVAGVGGFMLAEEQVLQKNILARYERWFAQSVGVQEQETLGGWECPVGGTNNMSYRKAVLESIGGFDEQFRFAAGEDADLKWRICQSGYSLLFVPVRATHLQLYTWSSVWRQARARGKGKWQFQKKYTGKGKSKIQILASVAFRSFMFWRDLLRLPDPRFAFIRCIESWGVAAGEWEMR